MQFMLLAGVDPETASFYEPNGCCMGFSLSPSNSKYLNICQNAEIDNKISIKSPNSYPSLLSAITNTKQSGKYGYLFRTICIIGFL